MRASFLLLSLIAGLSWAQNDTNYGSMCKYNVKPLKTNQQVNFTDFCKDRPCIIKCCPENQILFKNATLESKLCVDANDLQREFNVTNLNDYSSIDIYVFNEKRDDVVKTKKNFNDFTKLQYVNYEEIPTDCFEFILKWWNSFKYAKLYIMQDGSLRLRRFNYFADWFLHYDPGQFCYDRFLYVNEDQTVDSAAPPLVYLGVAENASESDGAINNRTMLTAIGMTVSCVFLALVLVVYSLLRDLRNLPGLMLMAHTGTMFAFFLLRAVHVFGNNDQRLEVNDCIVMTILVYYTMISSFSWMNVMSFDIWWTLRGMRKQRQIHRRGVVVKFLWYCAYAWGAPLAPTVFLVVVDNMDLTHLPYFIKPHVFEGNNCFFEKESFLLYLNIPIGLMICTNMVLFSMTAYNIWIVRRSVELNSCNKKNSQEDRYVVYIKLFLLMGVNWILEVLSMLVAVDSEVWYISDVLNGLFGVFIFAMFVCKRHIVRDLCTMFSINNAFVRRLGASGGLNASTPSRSTHRTVSDAITTDSVTHPAPELHID